jgi:predicted NUDIX family NTP pyrophosphohydrolase
LEETGHSLNGEFITLGEVTQPRGARLSGQSKGTGTRPRFRATSEMEWPPRSGRQQSFPEIDRRVVWSGRRASEDTRRTGCPRPLTAYPRSLRLG